MQKHAFANNIKQYETHYDPLPIEKSAALYYDKTEVSLPYFEDFPELHYHNRYEIGVCIKGDGLFLSEGKFASVSKGDVIFISPKSRHYSRSIDKNNPCLCRFFYYKPDRISQLLEKGNFQEQELENIINKIPTIIRASEYPNAQKAFKELADLVISEQMQKGLLIGLRLSALFLEARTWFDTENTELKSISTNFRRQSIKEVADFITLHYNEDINSKQLSNICHLSESQLRRQFIAAYGVPPIAYRNRLRGDIAAELLRRSDQSVSEIAESLGYTSTSDFYRMFKSFYGIPPSKYRKLNTLP